MPGKLGVHLLAGLDACDLEILLLKVGLGQLAKLGVVIDHQQGGALTIHDHSRCQRARTSAD